MPEHHPNPRPAHLRAARPFHIAVLWTILLLLALGVGGCSLVGDDTAQPQPIVPPARVICDNGSRRLEIASRSDEESLSIAAIDRESTLLSWTALSQFERYPTTVELAPGSHTLRVRYRDAIFSAEADLTLEAESGATYRLHRQVTALGVQFWLVDAEGQQVGPIAGTPMRSNAGRERERL